MASIAWIVFGFDSTWSMVTPFIDNFLLIITGKISLRSVWDLSQTYYGIGNHFSAPVIYGLAFISLSRYFETIGIKKSLNFCTTTALSLMSIGIFEIMWNSCFAYFQGQIWVITFQWKQITNLCAFIGFITIGLLVILYLVLWDCRPNFSKRSLILLLLTIGCWAFWINYPLTVGYITVDTSMGPWTNSDMFPQTYYCVDVIPDDNIAIGEPNWVQNDMVHFVNTFTKVVQTMFVLSVCMVRKKNG